MLSKARAWIEYVTRYVMSLGRREGSPRSMADRSPDGSGDSERDERLVANLIKLRPPVPLLKDEGPVSDRFGSGDIAKRLADVIERTDPPFTISLSGAWGVGKTTLARQLKDELGRRSADAQRIRVVEVDLWTEDLANLRRRLALEVAVELQGVTPDKRDKRLKEQAEAFDKELRGSVQRQEAPRVTVPLFKAHPWWAAALLALIVAGLWALWNVTVPSDPTIDAVGAKAVVTILTAVGIWSLIQSGLVLSLSSDATSTPPIEEKVGLRIKFKELVTGTTEDPKVLVVLDNLDRLTGDGAVEALSEIRSFVELPESRCVFLVPIDRTALVRHLVRSMEGDSQAARDYLDKFFNLDVLLTKPVVDDLRVWSIELLERLFPDVSSRVLSPVEEIVAAAAQGSPRATVRILNGIYTRAYLLPRPTAEAPARISLQGLAVVEALVTRFPDVLDRLDADPWKWLETVGSVRDGTDEAARRADLRWLLGRPRELQKDASPEEEDRRLAPFLAFVLFTRNTALDPDDIRTVITARPDRQWARVPQGRAARDLLLGGDIGGFAALLESASDPSLVLRVALDEVATNLQQGRTTAALNSVNALAPLITTTPDLADRLRATASELLLGSSDSLRQLSPAAVDFVFGAGLSRLPRGKSIAGRLVQELTPSGATPATSVVRAIQTVVTELDDGTIEATRAALPKLSDDELEPLFLDPAADHRLLAGPVMDAYVARSAAWRAAAAETAAMTTAARRLCFARDHAGWSDPAALATIFTNATAQVPDLNEDAMPVVDGLIALATDAPSSTELDTLAQALARSTDRRAFESSLKLPTSAELLKADCAKRLTDASADEFRQLVEEHRSELETAGVNVTEMASLRWAAGQGAAYARLALAPGRDSDADTWAASLAGIGDPSSYTGITNAVVPILAELGAERAAAGLMADISKRASTFTWATLGDLASVVAGLQGLSSPDPVVSALAARIGSIPPSSKSEIGPATAMVLAHVEAGIQGVERLPGVVAEHGAALGTIDLDHVDWLARQSSVRKPDVRIGLIAGIRSEDPSRVLPAIGRLAPSFLRDEWQVGKALVERAADAPVGAREPWLVAAGRCKAPPSGKTEERSNYASALDRAFDGDPTVESTVRSLREKLS